MPQNDASLLQGRPKLAEERLRHHWSQRELADQIGTTFVSVSRWERGITEPGMYYRQQLATIFGKSVEELDLLLTVEEDARHLQGENADDKKQDVSLEALPSTSSSSDEPDGTHDPLELPTIPVTESLLEVEQTSSRLIPIASQALARRSKHSDRQRLLNKVQMFWIRGLLEHSLQRAILIELALLSSPEAVIDPWQMILKVTSSGLVSEPEGMCILDIYDEVGGELLILGMPGSGKTTLLLELTSALLQRADEDETHPLPVVFNLSSWAQKAGTLTGWLIDELSHKYQVPRTLGQQWVAQDLILPLLDGLDEVAIRQRTACIDVINTYRQEHGLHPMVVCSRQGDYFAQEGRLLLCSAVSIQALTAAQVEQYLHSLGEPVASLRAALSQDPILQELTMTPFLLSILVLVYADRPQAVEHSSTTREQRMQDIFTLYVQRALERRWKPANYSQQEALHWLRWLAQQMQWHHDSIFYLEVMQPDWLTQERYRRCYTLLAVRLVMILLGTLVFFSICAAILGPSDFSYLMMEGLISLVIGGLLGGVFGGRRPSLLEAKKSGWKRVYQYLLATPSIRNGILIGCCTLFTSQLISSFIPSLYAIESVSFVIGTAAFGIICGLTAGIMTTLGRQKIIQPVEKVNWSWQNVRQTLRQSRHIKVSILLGITLLILGWLGHYSIYSAPEFLFLGFDAGAIYWFFIGLFSGITHNRVPEEQRIKPNHGMRQSLFNGLLIVGISSVVVWVSFVCLCLLIVMIEINAMPHESDVWDVTRNGVFIGMTTGVLLGMLTGGLPALQHFILRILLWREGSLPWRYAAFLDAMAECMLLQKVGGGYLFIHRLLLDYFATQEIEPKVDRLDHRTHHLQAREVPICEPPSQ